MEKSFLVFWIFFILIPIFSEYPTFNRILAFTLPVAVGVIYKVEFFHEFRYIPISIIIIYYPLILNRAIKVRINGKEMYQSERQYTKISIKLIIFFMIIVVFLMLFTFKNFICSHYNKILSEKILLLSVIICSLIPIVILGRSIFNTLFYMISPIIISDKKEAVGQVDRVWYEVSGGTRKTTSYYATFEEDNCVFCISPFQYKKFLGEKGSIYKYIIKRGLFGYVFMSKTPELVEEISPQEKENNLMEYNSMRRVIKKILFILLVFILAIFIFFRFIFNSSMPNNINGMKLVVVLIIFFLLITGIILILITKMNKRN